MLWFILAALSALLIVHVVSAIILSNVFTKARRRRVEGTPADLGLRYDEVQFTSADGIALLGWYMESPGARGTVVLVHDVDGTRADRSLGLLTLQRDYLRRGLNVLAFDLRGRGESGGRRYTFGARERSDVEAAVEFARTRASELPVIVHGFGLGGALAIVGAAEGLPVDLVIADSAFSSVRAYLRRRWSRIPRPTFTFACRLARRRFGADADALRPLDAVAAASPVPVLFIHGEVDKLVPVTHTLNIAAASLNPRNVIWRVPGAGHCTAYRRAPEAYVRRCVDFIEAAVPTRRVAIAVAS
jgi:alpha-beta hydrolase superfamily lysophospholipase